MAAACIPPLDGSVGPGTTAERSSAFPFLDLPTELLAEQLAACAAADLATLASAARLPPCAGKAERLPLASFVARLALEEAGAGAWGQLPAELWLRLFHYLRCARVACGTAATAPVGHLCAARPGFVRCGAGRCELPGEEVAVDAVFVAPLNAWRGRAGVAGPCCCEALPLPREWTVHANTQLEAVAPVTHCSQVLAVVPLRWGEEEDASAAALAAPPGGSHRSLAAWSRNAASADSRSLAFMARALNERGECAAVRTHLAKMHLLSLDQVRQAARSSFQPLLAEALRGFDGVDTPLWALVYTQTDPGFFCFS
mmetsp:Transcript_53372/g.114712  ORF Transcript_53372/g.114712 Transcript_53372/m.114712 type:complete len:313 (-) Transcript_53372:247-1185(-)